MCHCAVGYDAVGLDCVYALSNLCLAATCREGCTVTADGARCECGAGERAAALACVNEGEPACAGVSCSGHGRCEATGGTASCACDPGFERTQDGLGCARSAPEEACVAAHDPNCVAGRAYSACCRGMNCEYRFEDGTVLRGASAAAAWCRGGAPSLDGTCEGTPLPCSTFDGKPSECTSQFCIVQDGDTCSGEHFERDCAVLGNQAACENLQGCAWAPTPVDSPEVSDDGFCAGTPSEACASYSGDGSRCRLAGCLFEGFTGTCSGDFDNACAKHLSSQSCAQAPGCNWVRPQATDDWRCGATSGLCAPGRAFALCCDNACEARFEDGTVLRGAEATLGYCKREPPTEDGSCRSACWPFGDESSCVSAGCEWHDEWGGCSGKVVDCMAAYDRASCESHTACFWVPPDGSADRPGASNENRPFFADRIELPILASPPMPAGPCPAACGHGCAFPSGRIVDAGGWWKSLPNMDFCGLEGTPVLAVAEGVVIETGETYRGAGDYYVTIRSSANPNFSFIYDHVGTVQVTTGAHVSPGDPVAMIAIRGNEVGGFELQINERQGAQAHEEVCNCPARYATSEVNAALSNLLLAGHTSGRAQGWRAASWTLCERAVVEAY